MSRRRRVKLQCRVRHVESRPLSRCTLANCRQPSKFATPKLPVQPMRDTRTSSHDGVHTSLRGPRDDCRGEHGLRPGGLISTGAHRASHRPVAPAGSGWCSGPSRAPPRGADHAVPAGAAACSQLCKPHRSQYGCRATQLHQGRVRRLLVQWPPGPRLPAAALRRMRPRHASGRQLQAAWHLPLMRRAVHVPDCRVPPRPRHTACAAAAVSAVAADPAALAAEAPAPCQTCVSSKSGASRRS